MSSWCTIESDPGVFTDLISEIGVKGVQVEEVVTIDKEIFDSLKPIYGLIFLFKWQQERDTRPIDHEAPVFFARQVITNACATQALISVLLNCPSIDLGPELSNFKEFASFLDPESRGEAIGNSEIIRKVHNSFARPEPFVFEEKHDRDGEGEDAFHFIGYVPVNGTLYELDGLKAGPIPLTSLSGGDPVNDPAAQEEWLDKARNAIMERFTRYAAKEIKFNLLAIVKNRQEIYSRELESVNSKLGNTMDSENESLERDHLNSRKAELERLIAEEQAKHSKWKIENVRRKHNYVPFVFNLLKTLAEKGKLAGLVEHATKVNAERVARLSSRKQPTTSAPTQQPSNPPAK